MRRMIMLLEDLKEECKEFNSYALWYECVDNIAGKSLHCVLFVRGTYGSFDLSFAEQSCSMWNFILSKLF